ncbi:polysaccharide deacetylase family protein [Lysinibacillus piscis]|uniref:Peptidoglycan-N-acetylmuramic acid deacetylase PdaA n=1 Tax=Lysinibacillus piscis TaxID=2518931 RepID=A0ABQ5NQA9_9BACI|nr:polysaccharide deacetylase family protein [Lysinibacillus sp. KH24]GLC90306.1 peptidoglycan-N-acetylmuramic acid deacetylase PdaA [Lysinibacillus sp. KH24]
MWKQHIVGIAIATFIIAAGMSLNPYKAASADEYHWGFKRAKNGEQAEAGAQLDQLLDEYGAIYKGKPDKKVVYLTFDNGYENGFTASILDTLKKENAPATFFLTGHYLESAGDLVKRMVADGHTIGNHSYGHPNMAKLTPDGMRAEWKKFDDKLRALTGIDGTTYARPPEGIFNAKVLEVGNAEGYRHIFWSIAFKDWLKDERRGADYAYNALMAQLHPGAVILMHTVAQDNAEALPLFIAEAKKQGYTFLSLDELVLEYEDFPVALQVPIPSL